MFEKHYTGFGYPSEREIGVEALKRGFTHYYWATECSIFYKGLYNGDTVVVYDSTDGMPPGEKHDAEKYGKPIEGGR